MEDFEKAWENTKNDLQKIRNNNRKTIFDKLFIPKIRVFTSMEKSMFEMGYSQGVSDQMQHQIKYLKDLNKLS